MYTIYRSKTGALRLSFVMSKGKLEFCFAPTLNPNIKPNQIRAGQQVYNWDQALYFSLTIEEAMELALWLDGKINLNDNKFHKIHAQNGNNFIDIAPNKNGGGTYWIKVTNNQNSLSILANFVEINILKNMCYKLVQEFPWLQDMERYENYKKWAAENGRNNNRSQYNNNNNWNNNQNWKQQKNNNWNNNNNNQKWNNNTSSIQQYNNQPSQTPPPPPPAQMPNQQFNQPSQTPPPPPPMNPINSNTVNNETQNNNQSVNNNFFTI